MQQQIINKGIMIQFMSPKIFMCFPGRNRAIAESFVYHLKDYGFDLFYDRDQVGMSNKMSKHYDAADESKYVIVLFTQNSNTSEIYKEELRHIKRRYDKKENPIVVFPIFFEMTQKELDKEFDWIEDIIYGEIKQDMFNVDVKNGTLKQCNHIIDQVLTNELKEYKIQNLGDLVDKIDREIDKKSIDMPYATYKFILILTQHYLSTQRDNLDMRVSQLYSLFIHIELHFGNDIIQCPRYYKQSFVRINDIAKLGLAQDQRDIKILETIMIMLLNKIFECIL